MNRKKQKNILLKYGITALIGSLMAYAVLVLHGYGQTSALPEKYRILSDAFTIPGVVLILCAVLLRLSNEGIFDGISYALTYTIKMLIPGTGRTKQISYTCYIQQKREKRESRGYQILFYTGFLFFLTAIIFINLYWSINALLCC